MTEFLVYATLESVRPLETIYFGPGGKSDVLDVCAGFQQLKFWMSQEELVEGLLERPGSTEVEGAMW